MENNIAIIPKRWSYGWKGLFINDLIERNNYKSYLELGVDNACTWVSVGCDEKTGVDINPNCHLIDNNSGVQHKITSDTDCFFKDVTRKFDLIYIDASHEKEQTRRDFLNSVSCLNKNGIIVMHDIFPKTEKDTLPSASGDVFDVWMSLCDFLKFKDVCVCVNNAYRAGDNDAVGIYIHSDESRSFKGFKNKNYSFLQFKAKFKEYIQNHEIDNLNNNFIPFGPQ